MESKTLKVYLPKPTEKQIEILQSKARFKVLLAGRRFGKSLLCLIIAVKGLLNGEKIAYVTPEFSLSRLFLSQLLEMIPIGLFESINKSDFTIKFITGGELKFFSGENLNAFRGRKFHKIIIDEAAYIKDLKNYWASALRPCLADYKGTAIFISTPQGRNFFYSMFLRGKNKDKGYQSWHFTSYDNPYLDKEELDGMRMDMTEEQFNEEVMAIPGIDLKNPIGDKYITANIIPKLSTKETKILAIDVATVSDWTVVIGLDEEKNMTYFDRFQLNWDLTQQRIEALPKKITKVVDATGAGSILLSNLLQTCENMIGFTFTTKSKPAIMLELFNQIQKGLIKYTQEVADEMYVFQQKRQPSGYIKYEAQTGFHDDAICALAMANNHLQMALNNIDWKLYTV